jgi:hypothetical protein
MPPPVFFFGTSATMASVVIRSAATEAAFWIATRTTLVGSMMPLVTRLPYSPVWLYGVLLLLQDLTDDDGAVLARLRGTEQGDAAARQNAFFDGRAGRMHRKALSAPARQIAVNAEGLHIETAVVARPSCWVPLRRYDACGNCGGCDARP